MSVAGSDTGLARSASDTLLDQSITALQSGTDSDVAAGLDAIKAAQNHIVLEQTKQGVRSDRLDVIGTRLTNVDLDLKERRSGLESTDLQDVISSVSAKLLQLEAAQSAFARINQQNLFDLLK